MTGFLQLAESIARTVMAVVMNALWEDAVILLAVVLLVRLWRNLNAATRYAAWCIALLAAIAAPLLTTHPGATTRPIERVVPAYRMLAHLALVSIGPASATTPARSTVVPARERAAAHDSSFTFAPLRFTVPGIVALAASAFWAVAALYLLTRLIVALARLERLKHGALPLPMEYRDALARWNATEFRAVRLCVSDEIDVPVAVGLFDSMILIPCSLLESMSSQEIEQIYLHERAHLRRGDDWTNLLQRVATAIAWFSPGLYAIARALDVEREVACDDDVVAHTGAVRPYARCLTHMAEITAWPRHALAAPGAFVTRRGISERIERLLSAGRSAARGLALAPTAVALAAVGTLALAMPAMAVTIAAPQASPPPAPAQPAASPTLAPLPHIRRMSEPARHIHVRARHIDIPARHIDIPARHIDIPARHIDIPARHIDIPARHIDLPRMDYNMPAMNFTMPAIDVNVPAIDVDVPDYQRAIERQYRSPSCRSACNLTGVSWAGADLSGRSYTASDFTNANLHGADFAGDRLKAVDFTDADLRGANFNGADMSYVDFTDARLAGATFIGTRISVCDFSGTDLSHVDLSRAHLDTICKESLDNH